MVIRVLEFYAIQRSHLGDARPARPVGEALRCHHHTRAENWQSPRSDIWIHA